MRLPHRDTGTSAPLRDVLNSKLSHESTKMWKMWRYTDCEKDTCLQQELD